MGKYVFDHDDIDFVYPISDQMALAPDGGLLMWMGHHIAMDMDSGELHIIFAWSYDDTEN